MAVSLILVRIKISLFWVRIITQLCNNVTLFTHFHFISTNHLTLQIAPTLQTTTFTIQSQENYGDCDNRCDAMRIIPATAYQLQML